MFVAALADAFPLLRDEAASLISAQGYPAALHVTFTAHNDDVLSGQRLAIDAPPYGGASYPELDAQLAQANAEASVRDLARRGLRLLGEAEAAVHGVPLAQVHFHEIAGWDTLVDLLLAAFFAVRSGATSWSVAPLPLGGGRVETRHGLLPVPAPATAAILKGYRVRGRRHRRRAHHPHGGGDPSGPRSRHSKSRPEHSSLPDTGSAVGSCPASATAPASWCSTPSMPRCRHRGRARVRDR